MPTLDLDRELPDLQAVPADEAAGRARPLPRHVDPHVDLEDARGGHREDEVADRRVLAPGDPAIGVGSGAEQVERARDGGHDLGRHGVLPRRHVAPLAQPHRRPSLGSSGLPTSLEGEASTRRSCRRRGRPARNEDRYAAVAGGPQAGGVLPYDAAVDVTFIPSVAAVSGVGDRRRPRAPRTRHARARDRDPRRRHVDVGHRIAGRRRGPRQRHDRTRRDDPRLAAPERAVRLLHARSSTTTETARPAASGSSRSARSGFRVRDETGELRVFPRGARFEAPPSSMARPVGLLGEQPAGLDTADAGAFRSAEPDTAAQIDDLLRVHVREARPTAGRGATSGASRSYREARLEPGDLVTIVGQALPFSDLADPAGADLGMGTGGLADDPEVADGPRRGGRGGRPRGRSGRGVGQCRDPRVRDRPAGAAGGHRSGARTRCRSGTPPRRPAPSGRSRSRPRRWSSRRRPTRPC